MPRTDVLPNPTPIKRRTISLEAQFQRFSRCRRLFRHGHRFYFGADELGGVGQGRLVTGPLFRFSDGWQLVINTGTTTVTFLLAQRSQYR